MAKTYFISDLHLGSPSAPSRGEREKYVLRWIEEVGSQAEAIYWVGDLFDFYFEYNKVVPKGFTRFMGALARLSDAGIPMYFFTGNHDMWIFKYFQDELGITTFREPIQREIHGKQFFIGHGDGLGPGDHGYKFIKKVFSNKLCQWAFARIHPNTGIGIANYWSGTSREANGDEDKIFLGEDKEWLIQYCEDQITKGIQPDYFVFGHRHLPIDWMLSNRKSRYINLGEWIDFRSYATFDGKNLSLDFFKNPSKTAIRNH
jgi:UDP-2,3-diacylglucosamine hydrolase